MKKITLALVAFMLVLGMTQCKKEQQPNNTPTADGETVYITMKVADNGGKHVVYPGTGAVVYGNGDKIYVGNNGKYVGTLTYANGTFSGSITNPSTSDYLHFYFTGGKTPATNPTAGSTTSFTVDISNQSSKLPVLSYGHSTSKYIDGTTAYTCMLENQCGLVKFVPSIVTSEAISVGGMKTTATINFASGSEGITPVDATGSVTLYSVSDSEKWAILLPQNEVESPTVIVNRLIFIQTTIESVPVVTANLHYTQGVNIAMTTVPTGAVAGLFTINGNGDQVCFSQGNLQYNSTTGVWSFMEHQYDMVETTGQSVGTNYGILKTVSLFGWATSGYECNINYRPTTTDNNSAANYGPRSGSDLTTGYANCDWEVYNPISNGDNQSGLWRTLSKSEWDYVFSTRSTNSGIRYTKASVNNVNGVILLPDDWSTSYYTLNNTNSSDASFSSNTISATQWSTLEQYGAVFLPAAGARNGVYNYDVNGKGCYWSVTSDGVNTGFYAFQLYFNDSSLNPGYSGYRSNGGSVRLVRDVN